MSTCPSNSSSCNPEACGVADCPAAAGGPARSEEEKQLDERLSLIRRKVLVMSGKGGVGKSTVAVNLAFSLMLSGKRVGLLDVDMHGPSVPKLLGVEDAAIGQENNAIQPVDMGGLKVMSVAFMLPNADEALIWRGPLKIGLIQQFIANVEWGELDYLVVDLPPGTGDEPLSICQLIGEGAGAVVVSTPQDVALSAVRKSINFARKLSLPIIGVVENMSGFVCPHCNTTTDVFKSGGGERMAQEMGTPFLGRIPIDPGIGIASDDGAPFVASRRDSEAAKAFRPITQSVIDFSEGASDKDENGDGKPVSVSAGDENTMTFAIPVANGELCMHFGHCENFALVEVDSASKAILGMRTVQPPPHEPGVLPRFLADAGVKVVIAGGMGSRAKELFVERGIDVVTGAAGGSPSELVKHFMEGSLALGDNACDH